MMMTIGSKKGAAAALALVALTLMMTVLLSGCASPQPAAPSASSSAASSSAASSDAATAPSDDITVSVLLTEDVAGSQLQETQLQFSEETLTVNAPAGADALEALQATQREVVTEQTDQGTEVVSIGGLGNGDAGEGSHWTYEVNGTVQTEAPSACILQDGDQLTFRFVG